MKLSFAQDYVMSWLTHVGEEQYFAIGRYKSIKTIRTFRSLVKMGLIDIIEESRVHCVAVRKRVPQATSG